MSGKALLIRLEKNFSATGGQDSRIVLNMSEEPVCGLCNTTCSPSQVPQSSPC